MEPMAGIEPATDGLRNRCSTAELHWRNDPKNRRFRLLFKRQCLSQVTLECRKLQAACLPQGGDRQVENIC
jgi:hypothetical protein